MATVATCNSEDPKVSENTVFDREVVTRGRFDGIQTVLRGIRRRSIFGNSEDAIDHSARLLGHRPASGMVAFMGCLTVMTHCMAGQRMRITRPRQAGSTGGCPSRWQAGACESRPPGGVRTARGGPASVKRHPHHPHFPKSELRIFRGPSQKRSASTLVNRASHTLVSAISLAPWPVSWQLLPRCNFAAHEPRARAGHCTHESE